MLTVDYEQAISKKQLLTYEKRLKPELKAMRKAATSGYNDPRASINLCLDKKHIRDSLQLAKKHKRAKLLIVCGIGGSNLGTVAVQEALLGKLHNLDGTWPIVLYADTVDPHQMRRIRTLLEQTLKRKHHAVVHVVSKSGGTTETIGNFEVLLETLKKYSTPRKHVVVTTDEGSSLWKLAKQEKFAVLPIPKNVGGRYSVFSPVGLFPLALLGINIRQLLKGAEEMRTQCLLARNNPAIQRAAMLARARKKGKNIADNFYFKADMESVGKWYRQLMGESVGKEFNKQGKRVWMGITPTVSIGTTDLHSMAQLYFGGPKDKIHTLVHVRQWKDTLSIPNMLAYDKLVPHIQQKKLANIMDAVVHGVRTVLTKQRRPHCVITLPNVSEKSIGALLQLHMMEMMYLGALLNVNPFDQPNVEAYKIETKKVLSK